MKGGILFGKNGWKWLMYSDPKWYFYSKIWKSRDMQDAADEYEEELPYIAFGMIILIVIAVVGFLLLNWIGLI